MLGMYCCFTGQVDHGTSGVQFVQYTAVTVVHQKGGIMAAWVGFVQN